MTITAPEYAALSAYIYNDQRGGGGGQATTNLLSLSTGWQDLKNLGFTTGDYLNKNPFSFSAGTYINASGEIVAACKGTDFLVHLETYTWH